MSAPDPKPAMLPVREALGFLLAAVRPVADI